MLKHIIPMQLTEENAKIPLDITDDDSIQLELEELTSIPMLVHLIYGGFEPQSAIAGIAVAGIAIAGYVWS